MNKGKILIYCGEGKGKTASALGYAIRSASQGKSVIIIQFPKGKNEDKISFMRRLEPEIKLFRFEKSEGDYEQLSEDEKKEERMNIKNGFHFAKKVMVTGECSVLILDEFLGLLDNKMISKEELVSMMEAKSEDMDLVFTGRTIDATLYEYADEIYRIHPEKEQGA